VVDQTLASVVSALISTAGALVSVVYSRRAARGDRLHAAEQLAVRFREPLLQATFNLETRIYNIVELDFLCRFAGENSVEEEREYAISNTLYVIGQFFCWAEILRRDSQFIDPRSNKRNRRVARALEDVRDIFSDSRSIPHTAFRLFRGEQRALGELMLVPTADPAPGSPRWDCVGYAPFVRALDEDLETARWFGRLRRDIVRAADGSRDHDARLRLVQRQLVELVDIIDPDAHRIPSTLRKRLSAPGPGCSGHGSGVVERVAVSARDEGGSL
jgi:hypothetical protein